MTKAHFYLWSALCVALGASLTAHFAHPAQAQTAPRVYKECYLMKIWNAGGGKVGDKLAAVPAGWTPVGGAGGDAVPGVVLCR